MTHDAGTWLAARQGCSGRAEPTAGLEGVQDPALTGACAISLMILS